jgi:L-ribulose-5-phosphate 3-epimerase
MALTRRQLLAEFAFGVAGAAGAMAQDAPPPPRAPRQRTPKPRNTPAVCLYSQHLIKVEYDNLGMVLRDLGFDGCDLSVQPGGHVLPEKAGTDLMRAIEACTGVGLEVPLLTTSVTNGADPYGRQILGIGGFMGVPLFRPGYWKYNNAPDIELRLGEVQREMMGLATVARAYNMAMCMHNIAGDGDFVGAAIWDANTLLRGIDPRWVGYNFDPGYATEAGGAGGWSVALRLAMPRLKAVTVKDFYWAKDAAGVWRPTPCPLGEGMVDWPKFFAALARARFVGPVTIEMRYQPKDELTAIRRDLDFIRKQIGVAYSG